MVQNRRTTATDSYKMLCAVMIMGNMSHCRFENTYKDLQDCLDALDEGGITGVEENSNQREKPYVRKLVELCREIVDNYEDELDE